MKYSFIHTCPKRTVLSAFFNFFLSIIICPFPWTDAVTSKTHFLGEKRWADHNENESNWFLKLREARIFSARLALIILGHVRPKMPPINSAEGNCGLEENVSSLLSHISLRTLRLTETYTQMLLDLRVICHKVCHFVQQDPSSFHPLLQYSGLTWYTPISSALCPAIYQ